MTFQDVPVRRALLLEDNELRGRALRRKLFHAGYLVVWARNYSAACEELRGDRFDFATLDFDLEQPESGLDVACFIAGMPAQGRPRSVEVHSANDAGARLMLCALTAAGVPAVRKEIA